MYSSSVICTRPSFPENPNANAAHSSYYEHFSKYCPHNSYIITQLTTSIIVDENYRRIWAKNKIHPACVKLSIFGFVHTHLGM